MSDARLATLCRLFDIEPVYRDVWGKAHQITSETAHALITAMGVDLEQKTVEDVVAQQESALWRRTLPPVQVVRGSDRTEVVVRLPEDHARKSITYTLTLENGEVRHNEAPVADLAVRDRATPSGRGCVAYSLPLSDLPLGYHRLALDAAEAGGGMTLIVCPARCYQPEAIKGEGRIWGVAMQLYALRSPRNWGMGDFTDLRLLLEHLAEQGAGVIGVNPLHALYPCNPAHASPYSPSSRLFLNVMYVDVEGISDFAQCAAAQQIVYAPEFQRRLEQLRATDQVDYAGVAAAKFAALEVLFHYFRERHLARDTARARIFREYQAREGERLYRQALYDALQEKFFRQDRGLWGWPVWPEAFRDPAGAAVVQWAEENRERVEYYQYLQWQADRQLAMAGRRSYELGLGVGIYQDLAVSVDRGGAETWMWQEAFAPNVSIGAPPDDFSLSGQDWGLPPLIPARLRDMAYAPFIATLRANMNHNGALRVDHVMGLMRLFWIPQGATPEAGAYVRYPFDDLLGILALESERNRCLIVGEDLGTVPTEVRDALAPIDVLSNRVFYFERTETGEFKSPSAYPQQALAAVSTHDLPTLAGFWKGQDLAERDRLKMFPSDEERDRQVLGRSQDRVRILMALEREGLLPEGTSVDPASSPDMTPELALAVHAYLARSPAKIVMAQLEDATGELCQANLPGTVDEYPNWRRKLGLDAEHLDRDVRANALFAALRDTRGVGRDRKSVV